MAQAVRETLPTAPIILRASVIELATNQPTDESEFERGGHHERQLRRHNKYIEESTKHVHKTRPINWN